MDLSLPEHQESLQQRAILDALPALVFIERAGKIVFANAQARQMLGLEEGESIDRPVEDVLWGVFQGAHEPPLAASQAGGRSDIPFHATLLARNGRMLPIEGAYCMVNSEARAAVIVARPGGRERAPRSRLMEDVLASIPEAVSIVHQDHLLYTNPAFTRLFGYSADEVAGANLREFIVPETRLHEIPMITQGIGQHGQVALETVRKNKAGELVDVALLAGPLEVNGARVGYAISYRDIGERRQIETLLQHDAMHDVLTGLPNRALFLDRLTLAFSRRVRRRNSGCGILLIDLDRFQEFNNWLGRAAGDLLLTAVAERLRAALRPQDTAARLGGDEFAVLVEGILSVADLEIIAGRVLRALAQAHTLYGHSIQLSSSIGVAMAGPEHDSGEALLRDADYALHRARQAGGDRFNVFDRNLEAHITLQQERERELRQMLKNRQFEIWYEPIYRLGDGRLRGFESILRCARLDGKVDSFRDVLALAEDTGLYVSIGAEMTDAVCRQLLQWQGGAGELMLTVNLSHRQFYHPDLVSQLMSVLSGAGADPARLLFEVAERTLNESPDAAVAILQRLIDIDVRVAVDDFGSVLGPINHWIRLPVDVIKLDPKLTMAANAGGRQTAVLGALISLARSLGMQLVAQGIETPEQLEALRQMGCELGQGDFLSPAVDAQTAQELAALAHRTIAPMA